MKIKDLTGITLNYVTVFSSGQKPFPTKLFEGFLIFAPKNILNKTVESISGKSMFEIVVFFKEDEIMKLNDLKGIIENCVTVYSFNDESYESCAGSVLFKGYLEYAPKNIMNCIVRRISAKDLFQIVVSFEED